MKSKYTFRKFVIDLHLWVGLPSAIVLFIMCLTGTIYAFRVDITHFLDTDKYTIADENKTLMPLAALTAKVEAEIKGKISNIQIPENKSEAWTIALNIPEKEKADKKDAKVHKGKNTSKASKDLKMSDKKEERKVKSVSYFVNPYNGKILGDAQTSSSTFFATTLKLHRWLLMDKKIGGIITGTAALMMIFLQISGLILWFPAKIKSWKKSGSWSPGFKVKTDASFKRVNFDLHKTLGFYAFVFVTIMAVTGPYFAFDWYKEGFTKAMGVKKKENPVSKIQGVKTSAPLESILANANKIYTYQGNIRINMPSDSLGTFAVLKSQSGFLTLAAIDRVYFDQYTGNLVRLEKYSDKPLGEKITSSAKFIHTGELFGTFSKLLYFIACLLATSLPVSGFLIWFNKGKKEPKKGKTRSKILVSQV
ncbi:PepSY-associated TM helix domain-containing protein [Dyadobacter frigoris]|uniref:PepSY domain-containing protein n=1 Tax=Dyadobacter frigoris TaxID=2576211 RepID=A0A4U6CZR0_9BACT|nr:PepSY-associated TM helix domain-containing protein [Dyadobacter frigoris]TKT89415.1 PepSY domain-containing protein [Dyadobacter frigoris]GLU55444.1 membrane protein [Dyadobacter frigoris]